MELVVWIGILVCVAHSAMFSGLNLAFFTLSRLRLEAEAATGSRSAAKVLEFRKDSNFLLTTILWGNVGINVLLTLLADSVMVGAVAFVFSTFVITFGGEIIPQAYFSRRAKKMAAKFGPVLRFYQYLLYPFAKPSALMLDKLVGKEGIEYMGEPLLKGMIEQHIDADHAEIDFIEGRGALNFLEIDDVPVTAEGEVVDPASVITLPTSVDLPMLPDVSSADDPFVRDVHASGKKWVILTDAAGEPRLVLDADSYLRHVMFDPETLNGYAHCHRPIVVTNAQRPLGHIIGSLKAGMNESDDAPIEKDVVLLWTEDHKQVITGADLLGRLLQGIQVE